MNYEENKYWLWLSYLPYMWYDKANKYMSVFNNPEEIYKASEETLKKVGIFTEQEIYNILSSKKIINIEEKCNQMLKKEIKFVTINDEKYPDKLRIYDDKPLWLYYKGQLPENDEKLVGMVGARNCSQYGKSMAEHLSS